MSLSSIAAYSVSTRQVYEQLHLELTLCYISLLTVVMKIQAVQNKMIRLTAKPMVSCMYVYPSLRVNTYTAGFVRSITKIH